MAKKSRGRKRVNDLYFGPTEEEAVSRFMSLGEMLPHPEFPDDKNKMIWEGTLEEEKERNVIYTKYLQEPLNKMVESIIRRYKLYRKSVSFEELHMDTLAFLMTKAHKYNEGLGTRAYSYYGTICRNYVLGLLIKDDKKLKQILSYEDIYNNIEEDEKYSYTLENMSETNNLSSFIETISDEIKLDLEENEKNKEGPKKKMSDAEVKLGLALIDILDNWEIMFEDMEGGKKYNKISMLASIRENTGLTTKDIRGAMKRYTILYELLKNTHLDEGLL